MKRNGFNLMHWGTSCAKVRLAVCALVWVTMAWGVAETKGQSRPADDAYRLAAGYYARSQWAEAEQAFGRMIVQAPNGKQIPEATFFRAESQMQQGKFEVAYAAFQGFLRKYPDHEYASRATFRMGESAFRIGRYDTAIRMLEEFIRKNPKHSLSEFALPYLGQLRLARDEPQLAQMAFETSLKRHPGGVLADQARLGLAKALQQLGDWQQASRFFRFLEGHSDPEIAAEAGLQLGVIAMDGYQLDEAEKRFRQTLQLAQGESLRGKAALWLARLDLENGSPEAALNKLAPLFNESLESSVQEAICWEAIIAAVRAERFEQAGAWLKRFRRSFSNSLRIKQAVALEVDLLIQEGKSADAETLVTRFDLEDKKPLVKSTKLEMVGREHYQAERYQQAVAVFAELLNQEDADQRQQNQWRYLKALAHLGDEDYESARKTLTNVPMQDLDKEFRPLCELALANAQFGCMDYQSATAMYRRYLESSTTSEHQFQAKCELAICLAKTGDLPSSHKLLDQLVESNREMVSGLETAVEILVHEARKQRNDSVLQRWLNYLASSSQDASRRSSAMRQLALSRVAMDDLDDLPWDQLKSTMQRLAKDPSTQPVELQAMVQLTLERARKTESEDPDIARRLYELVVNYAPNDRLLNVARQRMARLFQSEGGRRNLLQARTLLERYLATGASEPESPDDPQPLAGEVTYQLGWLAIDLGDPDQGHQHFESLVRDYPDSKYWSDAAYRVLQRLIASQDYQQGHDLARRILAKSALPDEIRSRTLFLQSQIDIAEQRWDSLEASMRQLTSMPLPADKAAEATYWLAEAVYQLGKTDEAIARFEQLQNLSALPESRRPWVKLRQAQCLGRLGHWEQAADIADGSIDEFPEFESLHEWHFLIGRGRESAGLLSDAQRSYQRAIDTSPGGKTEIEAMAQWRIGETYFHQEDYAQAIAAYYKVDSLYDYPKWRSAALLQAGKCQELLGNPTNAGKLYRQLLNRYPDSELGAEASKRLAGLKPPARVTNNPLRTRQ